MNKTQARRIALRNIVAASRADIHNGADYWRTDPDDSTHEWTDEEYEKIEKEAHVILDTMERHTLPKKP